jgi:signal peptidase I
MLVNQEAIGLISQVMRKHRWIEIPAKGTSMYPFIQEGDVCVFETCAPTELRKGDVILFHTVQGRLVTHRFYEMKTINGDQFFIFKGDTNFGFDEPVLAEQIIGRLSCIKRRKAKISARGRASILWSKAILSFPYLSQWIRFYVNRKAIR